MRETAGGHGDFRETDGPGVEPQAVFEHREHALLLAAVLPGVGRERLFHIDPEGGVGG